MNVATLAEDLATKIAPNIPLRAVSESLRELRQAGISREDLQLALETLRQSAPDEASEDRVLEILDLVTGFCSRELSVGDD